MKSGLRAAYIQLFVACTGLTVPIVILFFRDVPSPKDILWAFISLFASTVVLDRLAAVVQEHTTVSKTDELITKSDLMIEKVMQIPGLIAQNNNVVVFHRTQAFEYCIAAAPSAVQVLNNVMRYGNKRSSALNDLVYERWRETKRKCIEEQRVSWIEIVSAHIEADDGQRKFMADMDAFAPHYEAVFLDDVTSPMVQITLFDFGGGKKEVLFGWEFPHAQQGVTILMRNNSAVDYFEKYFEFFRSKYSTVEPLLFPVERRNH